MLLIQAKIEKPRQNMTGLVWKPRNRLKSHKSLMRSVSQISETITVIRHGNSGCMLHPEQFANRKQPAHPVVYHKFWKKSMEECYKNEKIVRTQNFGKVLDKHHNLCYNNPTPMMKKSTRQRTLTESRGWWDRGRGTVGEWTSEGGQSPTGSAPVNRRRISRETAVCQSGR